MHFASPLYLLALLPWAMLTIYLLRGGRERVDVPFVALWRGPGDEVRKSRRWAMPSLPVFLTIVAMLVAILAAAKLLTPGGESTSVKATVILDRGWTMTARGESGKSRLGEAIDQLSTLLHPDDRIEMRTVPSIQGGVQQFTFEQLKRHASALPEIAAKTQESLSSETAAALGETGRPVIVVSDQILGQAHSDRVFQIVPAGEFRNSGISAVAARKSPSPQVMVRIWSSDPSSRDGLIKITFGEAEIEKAVKLPKDDRVAGQDVFVDLPSMDADVDVQLMMGAQDAFAHDNRAKTMPEGRWPRIEIKTTVSAGLTRLVRTYAKSRPSDEASIVIPVVAKSDDLNGLGVVVAPSTLPAAKGTPRAAVHPLTQDVDWDEMGEILTVADAPPESEGWTPLLSLPDGKPLIAVREQPARQMWVGFDAPDWPRQVSFVVFWGRAFDWVASSEPAEPLDAGFLTTPPMIAESPPPQRFSQLIAALRTGGRFDASRYVALASVVLAAFGVACWRKPAS